MADDLEALRRLFLIDDQPAFNPNMRPSVRVGKTPERHLAAHRNQTLRSPDRRSGIEAAGVAGGYQA
ncbi:MAG: hypothetical protein ABF811_00460 [Pseudoclavibacter sp.]